MANEMRVGIGEEGSLTGVLNMPNVISLILKLPVDLGHVTRVVAASRDWVFRPRLAGSGFSPHMGGAVLGPARRGWC